MDYNWCSHIHFNSCLSLYFYSVTDVLSEITIMLLCSTCHTQFSSGCGLRRRLGRPTVIPHHIEKKKCINSVNFYGNKKYTDNLCFFRCLYLKLRCKCKDNTRKRCACLRKSSSVSASLDLLNQYAKSINAVTNAHKCRPETHLQDVLDYIKSDGEL